MTFALTLRFPVVAMLYVLMIIKVRVLIEGILYPVPIAPTALPTILLPS